MNGRWSTAQARVEAVYPFWGRFVARSECHPAGESADRMGRKPRRS